VLGLHIPAECSGTSRLFSPLAWLLAFKPHILLTHWMNKILLLNLTAMNQIKGEHLGNAHQ
jgi:hypothetical protein